MEMDAPPLIHNSGPSGVLIQAKQTKRVVWERREGLRGDLRASDTSRGHERTVGGDFDKTSLTSTAEKN